jgi:hypothetical protein
MFQLNKGGLGAPVTPIPKFDATPFPELFTPIVNKATPVDFTNSVQNVKPIDMNTIKGVSGKVYTSDNKLPLPPISSGSTGVAQPTLNSVVRQAGMPSYIPSDTPAGLISRDDWENYDDVNFYVGTDGKYHSTEPFFERLFWREGKNDLNALDKKKLHSGPAQFDKGTWDWVMPGIDASNRTNPEYIGKASINLAKKNASILKRAGVPLNAATIYGAHNLGAKTIINMYRDLDAPLTGQDLSFVLGNFRDAEKHAPELYKKYLRDPNSLTGRDYINLINAIFTN